MEREVKADLVQKITKIYKFKEIVQEFRKIRQEGAHFSNLQAKETYSKQKMKKVL